MQSSLSKTQDRSSILLYNPPQIAPSVVRSSLLSTIPPAIFRDPYTSTQCVCMYVYAVSTSRLPLYLSMNLQGLSIITTSGFPPAKQQHVLLCCVLSRRLVRVTVVHITSSLSRMAEFSTPTTKSAEPPLRLLTRSSPCNKTVLSAL